MFLRCVVLGSAVVVAFSSSLELLLDDAGQYIRPGAAWTKAEGECAQAGHEGGFHHNDGVHNEESFASWNFTVTKDGCYWVEEFHPDTSGCKFTLSSKVPVQIYFCRGLHTAGLVDQSQRAGQWNKLARLPFYTSHTAAIHISTMGLNYMMTAGVWAADAFRLTWDAEDCHDKETEPNEAVAPPEYPTEPAAPVLKDEANVAEKTKSVKTYTEKSTLTLDFQSLPKDVTAKSLIADTTFINNVVESIATGLNVDPSKLTITSIQVITARRMKEEDNMQGEKIKVEYELVTTSLAEATTVQETLADPAKAAAFSETTSVALVEKEAASGRVVVVKEIIPEEANMQAPAPAAPAAPTVEKEEKEPLKEEPQLPLLQALVDDADIKAHGATLESLSQCPATARRTFHHDGLQKGRRSEATFHFDPPHDGCYLIEEMHPRLEQCGASANTKVHVKYCKGLKAVGTVDQTAKGGQWTFIAALPFYAGHPGNVTLSNEGTEPGTLTVFDQVRFTWSAKSCRLVDAHPRQAEIRMTQDFQTVANRLPEFGSALKAKLATLASVPESSLRLTGLRSGSIIAEFIVLPSVVDDPLTAGLSPRQTIELLRGAVAKNAAELCALTGGPVEGCNVELKDLGIAVPSVRPVQQKQQSDKQTHNVRPHVDEDVIIVICGVAAVVLLIFLYIARSRKAKNAATNSEVEVKQQAESEVLASIEEGKSVEEKKPEGDDDNNSTLCPSNSDKQSDKQSEPSVCGDVENASTPEQGMTIIKALSDQSL